MADLHFTPKQMRQTPWCLVDEDVVHAADWSLGWLTTLHSDSLFAKQERLKIGGNGVLWRDRKSLGLPICETCIDEFCSEEWII